MKIPISKPCFGAEENRAIVEPLETGWIVQGPKVAEFERRFAAHAGAKYALAATSCTTALQLALEALGIGPGDEVLVPAFTWIATANVVEHQRARPVFVDIELSTFNIDVRQIESSITNRTRAIMPVSLFGLSADMDPILAIARKRGLLVIEDAACAVGAWYKGHHAGALADAGCFSFHPRKSITTGEGGMLITQSDTLAEKAKALRDHGACVGDLARHLGPRSFLLPEFKHAGFNFRMTDLQGALGVAQMNRLDWILQRRAALAKRYNEHLASLESFRTPITPPDYVHGYQAYVCLFAPQAPNLNNADRFNLQRNLLMTNLEQAGIATRPGTHAVHMLEYYRKKYSLTPEQYPNAYLANQLSIALPLYPQMTDQEQDEVIAQCRLHSESAPRANAV